MQGQKAVVILIIAMIITGGIGFFANFEKQGVDKTEYNPIGNMDAFVSANSERAKESEVYNSVYNVTGWSPTTGVATTTNPNQYILQGQTIGDIPTDYTYVPSAHGYTILESRSLRDSGYAGLGYPHTSVDQVFFSDGATGGPAYGLFSYANWSEWGTPIGGYGTYLYRHGTAITEDRYYQYSLNGSVVATYQNNNALIWVNLGAIYTGTPIDGDRIYFNSSVNVIYQNFQRTLSIDTSGTTGNETHRTDTTDISGSVSGAFAYLEYDSSIPGWHAYRDVGGVIQGYWYAPTEDIYLYQSGATIQNWSLTHHRYTVTPPTYADPTKYVNIETDYVWSNYDENNSFINSGVTILVKGSGTIDIGTSAVPTNYAGQLAISKVGSIYMVDATVIGNYIGLRITLSSSDNSITVEGILSDNSGENDANTPTYTYTVGTVTYTVPHSYTIPDIYRLKFTSTNGMMAYISETMVYTDPNQILWADINLNLQDYFEEYLTKGGEKLRVLLQGFVRYGDTISVNGRSFNVVDDGITVTVTEVITPAQGEPGDEDYKPPVLRTYDVQFKLSGLAIDYYNNHVYLNQFNGTNSVDLGEIQSYSIKMGGIWYFSSTASSINVYRGYEDVWKPGWSIDMNTTLLLFAGCVLLLFVLMMMRFRDMMDWEDIVILICSVVLPLVLVAV